MDICEFLQNLFELQPTYRPDQAQILGFQHQGRSQAIHHLYSALGYPYFFLVARFDAIGKNLILYYITQLSKKHVFAQYFSFFNLCDNLFLITKITLMCNL